MLSLSDPRVVATGVIGEVGAHRSGLGTATLDGANREAFCLVLLYYLAYQRLVNEQLTRLTISANVMALAGDTSSTLCEQDAWRRADLLGDATWLPP